MALEMKYFVLNPRSKVKDDSYAEASREAMIWYAGVIGKTDPQLEQDLRDWVRSEVRNNKELD